MQDDFMPTLTMDEYADIYRRAYRRGAKNCDPTYRRLVREAIAAKRKKIIAATAKEQK